MGYLSELVNIPPAWRVTRRAAPLRTARRRPAAALRRARGREHRAARPRGASREARPPALQGQPPAARPRAGAARRRRADRARRADARPRSGVDAALPRHRGLAAPARPHDPHRVAQPRRARAPRRPGGDHGPRAAAARSSTCARSERAVAEGARRTASSLAGGEDRVHDVLSRRALARARASSSSPGSARRDQPRPRRAHRSAGRTVRAVYPCTPRWSSSSAKRWAADRARRRMKMPHDGVARRGAAGAGAPRVAARAYALWQARDYCVDRGAAHGHRRSRCSATSRVAPMLGALPSAAREHAGRGDRPVRRRGVAPCRR